MILSESLISSAGQNAYLVSNSRHHRPLPCPPQSLADPQYYRPESGVVLTTPPRPLELVNVADFPMTSA